MKLKFLILNFSFLILTACGVTKPVATTHTERIEERVMPVAVGADTIEITEYRLRSTDLTPSTTGLPLKQGKNMRANQFSANAQKYDSPILSSCLRGTSNAEGVKIKSTRANQFSANAQKYDSPILSPCIRGTSEAEGVKIKSTRAVNIQQTKTDTTRTLRITLRPDTVFVPYTNHIRSDTIIIPDRICKTKLQKTQTANTLLILILIIVIIFLFKQKYKFYR